MGNLERDGRNFAPTIFMVGTARCAVRARRAGATTGPNSLLGHDSGGFTAGDAAARRPYLMVVVSSCAQKWRGARAKACGTGFDKEN